MRKIHKKVMALLTALALSVSVMSFSANAYTFKRATAGPDPLPAGGTATVDLIMVVSGSVREVEFNVNCTIVCPSITSTLKIYNQSTHALIYSKSITRQDSSYALLSANSNSFPSIKATGQYDVSDSTGFNAVGFLVLYEN